MLADGCAAAWNAGNFLAAVLCARAIMETAAVLYDFHARLRALCEAGDFSAVDDLVMNRIFSTRLTDWEDQGAGVKAVNILTVVEKVDKDIKGTFCHYEYLSEMCHPNSLGHNLMFGNLNCDTGVVSLSDVASLDKAHFSHVFGAFFLINLVELYLQKIDTLLPCVAELSEAYKQRAAP